MTSDPALDAVREVRRRISAGFGHDLAKLVAHYEELQREFGERLIRTPEQIDAARDRDALPAVKRTDAGRC